MIAYTEGVGRVRHLWAAVCKSYGIHAVAQTKREAKSMDRYKLPGRCGPHRLVKLSARN